MSCVQLLALIGGIPRRNGEIFERNLNPPGRAVRKRRIILKVNIVRFDLDDQFFAAAIWL
ncbi:hypothetical protein D3C80_2228650 [compost metagenome]